MAVEYVNRRGDVYYLHQGTTRTGKARFFFSRQRDGTLAETIPPGYEVYENPNAQVFLRKAKPRLVAAAEVALVERGVGELAKLPYFVIDVKDRSIVVHLPNENAAFLEGSVLSRFGLKPGPEVARQMQKFLSYSPMLRFTLVEERTRRFAVERWCFLGSIDDWLPLSGGRGDLQSLVNRYCPHLGQESFFELL